MANVIGQVIDEIEHILGKGKISAVSTDNASNMVKAWKLIEENRLGVFSTGCSAHASNLLLQDVFKTPLFKRVRGTTIALTSFIRNHSRVLELFSSIQKGTPCKSGRSHHSLGIPVTTRWYSTIACITSVVENRKIICAVFADTALMTQHSGAEFDTVVDATVYNDLFWIQAQRIFALIHPMVKTIALFEQDNSCLSLIYAQF